MDSEPTSSINCGRPGGLPSECFTVEPGYIPLVKRWGRGVDDVTFLRILASCVLIVSVSRPLLSRYYVAAERCPGLLNSSFLVYCNRFRVYLYRALCACLCGALRSEHGTPNGKFQVEPPSNEQILLRT